MRSSSTRKERRKYIAEFFFISLFGPENFHHCVRHNVRFWSKTIRNFYSCRKVFKVIDQNRTWFSNHLNWELNTSHRCDRNEPDNIARLRRLISSSEHWTSHFHWLHLELNWTHLVAFRVKCRASPSSIVNLITFFNGIIWMVLLLQIAARLKLFSVSSSPMKCRHWWDAFCLNKK